MLEKEVTSVAETGELFKSNQVVPISGDYEYVRHVNPTYCPAAEKDRHVTLQAGEKFPVHKDCLRWVYWQMANKT